MIRKMTKAFQLKPMLLSMMAFQYEGLWFPITEGDLLEKEVFIKGHGWVKILQRMRKTAVNVPNLGEGWTAQDLKDVADKFSLDVATGMLQGWGGQQPLFNDQSVGLSYAKHEVANMAHFGKLYDEFTDKVHDLSQRFIKHLMEHEHYRFEGAWLYHKEKLIGQAGLYEEVWLSPLQHIDHLLKGIAHVRPMFDPIRFDEMLVKLFLARDMGETLLGVHVSISDRIKYLTTEKIAEDFEQIFEWQKVFHPEEENVKEEKEN